MRRFIRIIRWSVVVAVILVLGAYGAMNFIYTPWVKSELADNPDGETAKEVLLLGLPSGKSIPVNYLREGDRVFMASDFSWHEELRGDGAPVTLFIRGETYRANAQAIENYPEFTEEVFARLRPYAFFLSGVLVVADILPTDEGAAAP